MVCPLSDGKVVTAIVRLRRIHLGVLCGAFRDARRSVCDLSDTSVQSVQKLR
jgi:hypothetical protein